MRCEEAAGSVEDLFLLLAAILAFCLFFASLAAAFVTRVAWERTERIQDISRALVAAVRDGPKWTQSSGVLRASGLDNLSAEDLADVSAGHPFRVTIRDVLSDVRWVIERGREHGDQWTSVGSASIVANRVDPARITATVWA